MDKLSVTRMLFGSPSAPPMRFLYPQRKRLEMLSAIFAGGFGVYVWTLSYTTNPLWWAGLFDADARDFGQVITCAALIHAAGVRINGSWRWSPVLRLFGMVIHAAMFGWLAFQGISQTMAYIYSWGCGLLLTGAYSALKDTIRAVKGPVDGN